MGEIREAVVENREKKKHKKRKHEESKVSVGEDGPDVVLDEGEVRDGVVENREKKKHKKRKHEESKVDGQDGIEGLSSNGASDVVVDVGVNVSGGDRPRKKKKKEKSKNGEDGILNNVEGLVGTSVEKSMNDNERTSSGVMNSEAGVITEDVKSKKDKKEKKKKSRPESESIEVDGKETGLVGDEKVDSVKKKKRREKDHGSSEKEEHTKDNIQSVGDEKDDPVKKKKRKEKARASSEKEEHANDNTQSMKNDVVEVAETVEHAEVQKKKKTKKTTEKGIDNGNADEVEAVKKKGKAKKNKGGVGDGCVDEESVEKTHMASVHDGESSKDGTKKKRKKKSVATNSEEKENGGIGPSKKSKPSKKSRKVKFADSVQVIPLTEEEKDPDAEPYEDGGAENGENLKTKENEVDGLVQGKRFTKEEDEILRNAVLQYVEDNHLGEKGLEMVMKCSQHRDKVDGCWNVIRESLPYRPKEAVYKRAHTLFERSESRTWTKEELEEVRLFHEKHGPKWRQLADEIGRNRVHVKDAFRQVRLANKKTGHFSQDEYQKLFDLVNKDLRIRANMDRKSKHGMLRENIGWEAISMKLGTRTDPYCCLKWYDSLTSKMVVRGDWADTDDYRLVMALDELDPTCEEEVEWDCLLDHRSGDLCRKRWHEMVRHIGDNRTKSFSQQIEILSRRYEPDVLEAREIYNSKPFVD